MSCLRECLARGTHPVLYIICYFAFCIYFRLTKKMENKSEVKEEDTNSCGGVGLDQGVR